MLRQGKDALSWMSASLKIAESIQGIHRAVVSHLRKPEDRLTLHLGIGIAADRLQQDVFGAVRLLRATRKTAFLETDRAGVAAGEYTTEHRPSSRRVHLLQRVQGGDLHVVIAVGTSVPGPRA